MLVRTISFQYPFIAPTHFLLFFLKKILQSGGKKEEIAKRLVLAKKEHPEIELPIYTKQPTSHQPTRQEPSQEQEEVHISEIVTNAVTTQRQVVLPVQQIFEQSNIKTDIGSFSASTVVESHQKSQVWTFHFFFIVILFICLLFNQKG